MTDVEDLFAYRDAPLIVPLGHARPAGCQIGIAEGGQVGDADVVEPHGGAEHAQRPLRDRGPGSRIKGLTMAWKLLTMTEQRWRRLNGGHLLPVVREGAKFVDGVRVERQDYEEVIAA